MSNIGNKEILAANLTFYAKQAGVTQKDIAEICGTTPAAVNDWFTAKKYPRIDKIEMLANFFHINKSDIIEAHRDGTDALLSDDRRYLIEAVREKMTDAQIRIVRQIVEEVLRERA